MTYTVPPPVLPGNILSLADSDFEVTGFTWAADTNANAPARNNMTGAFASSAALSGSWALAWTATANGDTIISTGFYPCSPGRGFAISGGLLTVAAAHDSFIGVRWYDSTHTHISDSWGKDFPTAVNIWQSQVAAVTSPVNAAYFKVAAWVSTNVLANENFAIDLTYAAITPAQVLIDWVNPAFSSQSMAGIDFFDMTPWVRYDSNITTSRGRQAGISEIAAGSAQFIVQNDMGWFTPGNSGSPVTTLGGTPGLGARCQVNATDEQGHWHTRFDGPVAEIDYTISTAAGAATQASIVCADVLAYLARQQSAQCWTKQAIMQSKPWLHWTLDDANNAGSAGNAAETGGNNGPPLHAVTSAPTGAAIAWRSTNAGVETMADAVATGLPDESEFWYPGSAVSTGVYAWDTNSVGPYTTPLPNVRFTPVVVTTGTVQNNYVNVSGYTLTGELSASQTGVIAPNAAGVNYALEAFFEVDPNVWTFNTLNTGPWIAFSLGGGTAGQCLVAGLFVTTNFKFEVNAYLTSPSVPVANFGGSPPSPAFSVSSAAMGNGPGPHHVVVNITGASTGASAELWLDGTDYGSVTLPAGAVYDTICVGGAFGGFGCWYGNIQLFSIYQRLLPIGEIQSHFRFGQYGMWEQTTDNCIAAIAQNANVPPFWNGLTGQSAGLSLTDYLDITGSNALTAMQTFEQAEQGLLYVPASGALQFATRDWRMGYGKPDVQLPPDVYTSDLKYQLIDQYLINQAAIATQTYQKGVEWLNAQSGSQYGSYVNGTAQSPVQLPLITWNRAFTQLGLPAYNYWPDPALNDNVAWQVNTRSAQRLTMGSLTVDLLTLDPLSGITISQLYGIDINNMVSLLPYDSTILSLSPVSYYALDDGAGADLAGNGGTLVPSIAGAAVFVTGQSPAVSSPSSAYFNATGVLASTYAPGGGSSWSAECWVNLNGAAQTGNPRLFNSAKSDVDHTGFEILLSSGTTPSATFGNGSTAGTVTAGSVLPSTGWHYLTATWNGSVVTLYVDGGASGTAALTGALGASTGTVTIGGPATYTGSDLFAGLIGQCALTPVCLTQAQVLARFAAAQNGQPASLSNSLGASELFIEGVSEVIGLSQRSLQFYTSPAAPQRAWIPGDPVYGRLGATSRIGISGPDTSVTQAIGKDVSHDANGPYWPPQFLGVKPAGIYRLGSQVVTGTAGTLPIVMGNRRSLQNDALLVQIVAPAAAVITVGPDTEGNTYSLASSVTLPGGSVLSVFLATNCAPMNSADTIPVTMSVSQLYTMTLCGLQNVTVVDRTVTASGTGTTASASTGSMAVPYELEVAITANTSSVAISTPAGWTLGADLTGTPYESILWKQATSATAGTDTFSGTYASSVAWGMVLLTFKLQPLMLNNPAANGHQFIGSLEIRGLHDTLATALHPPLAVVGCGSHTASITSGGGSNPVVNWDDIHFDSANGMGAVPGYPAWYTCLVPGFYELYGSVGYATHSSGATGLRTGYLTVEQHGAQTTALGGTPGTANSAVCPIGEMHTANNFSISPCMNPSTRIYLGVGDMVSLCTTNNSTDTLISGSVMGLRWCGYSTLNDQVELNSNLGGAGTVTQSPSTGPSALSSASSTKRTYTTSWAANATYSYYGTASSRSPQLRATNADIWQGTESVNPAYWATFTGSQFGFVVFPYAAIRTALTGATIVSVNLSLANASAAYSSATMILGWSTRTTWGSTLTPAVATDFIGSQQVTLNNGQSKSVGLYSWANAFATTATSLFIGDNNTSSLQYYGDWGSGPSSWTLTITYTK